MTTDKLSQEEIKGLLKSSGEGEKPVVHNRLTQVEQEALTELLNVAFGGAAPVISSLFSKPATISAYRQSIVHRDKVLEASSAPLFLILGDYKGGINGLQMISISKSAVEKMAELINPDKKDEERQFQVLQNVIQQLADSVAQTMSMIFEQEVSHSLSGMDVVENQQQFPLANFTEEEWFAESCFHVAVEGGHTADLNVHLPVGLAKKMTRKLIGETNEAIPEEMHDMELKSNTINKSDGSNETPVIQSVQFSNFDEPSSIQAEPNNLNMLLDIPLQVTVELGRTKRMVKEILNVSPGSIIELDKLAGEPVDILINNKLIAVGEVVVIDENFGVRVTDILSTAERISKLR